MNKWYYKKELLAYMLFMHSYKYQYFFPFTCNQPLTYHGNPHKSEFVDNWVIRKP